MEALATAVEGTVGIITTTMGTIGTTLMSNVIFQVALGVIMFGVALGVIYGLVGLIKRRRKRK